MPDPERFAAVVLAAGASRRFGRNKMLLEIDGEPLVYRAVSRALAAGLDPVIAVLGFEAGKVQAALSDLRCEIAVNPDHQGPSSGSLHRGIHQVPEDRAGLVVVLPDMPWTSRAMLEDLLATARNSAAPLVVSRYGDVTAPPLLFRRELFAELLAWRGEGCGKQVVRRHAAEAVYRDRDRAALRDIDTPDDLGALSRTQPGAPNGAPDSAGG